MGLPGTEASFRGKLISWSICGALIVVALLGGLFAPDSLSKSEPKPAPTTQTAEPAPDPKKIHYVTPEPPSATPPHAALLRLAGATVVVLILCVVTLWIGKRWLRPVGTVQGGLEELKIVSGVSLGNRCMVYVLQAGKSRIVAGLDASGIKTIVPLPESFEPEQESEVRGQRSEVRSQSAEEQDPEVHLHLHPLTSDL